MENMITTLRGRIEDIIETSNSELFKDVALDILNEEDEDIESHMKDVMNHGCVSGTVSSMIYYNDTRKFFEKHYDEIFDLIEGLRCEFDIDAIVKEFNFNNLSWLAYEECTRKLMNELEIEY